MKDERPRRTDKKQSRDNYSGPLSDSAKATYLRVGENDQVIDTLRDVMALHQGGAAISPALLKLDPVCGDPLQAIRLQS